MLPVTHEDQFWPDSNSAPYICDNLHEKLPANRDSSSVFQASPRRSPLLVRMRIYLFYASFYTAALLLLFFFSSYSFSIGFTTFLGSDPQIHSEWNVLYHLGGNGPWIPRVDNVVEGGIGAPDGCEVDMIHMVRTAT